MSERPRLRLGTLADAGAIAHVFRRAVLEGARDHYTPEQRAAWAGPSPVAARWRTRLTGLRIFVAETDVEIVGFMTLARSGLVDHAFVLPEHRGTGIALALYRKLEDAARGVGLARLHSDASHLARPFFERQGWDLCRNQTVTIRGVALINFRMEKRL